jgi:predicted DsbA family dithiol-disulfide isomerase
MPAFLRLYSDFVCPFCFIAEQSTVPRLLREFDLVLDWRGFELHPQAPRGGMPLSALFPGARLPAMREHLNEFAARFGVTEMVQGDHLPNTRRALAIAELARDQGRLEKFRAAAMEAYWRHGKDLERDADLREIAGSVGLNPIAALGAADHPTYLARVDEKQAEAKADGVTGIPTFFIGDEEVIGCRPYEALAQAARRARVHLRP